MRETKYSTKINSTDKMSNKNMNHYHQHDTFLSVITQDSLKSEIHFKLDSQVSKFTIVF